MDAIAEETRNTVMTAASLGWDGDALEAQAFAFLAVRSLRGLVFTYPTNDRRAPATDRRAAPSTFVALRRNGGGTSSQGVFPAKERDMPVFKTREGVEIFYKDWGPGASRSCSAMAGRCRPTTGTPR